MFVLEIMQPKSLEWMGHIFSYLPLLTIVLWIILFVQVSLISDKKMRAFIFSADIASDDIAIGQYCRLRYLYCVLSENIWIGTPLCVAPFISIWMLFQDDIVLPILLASLWQQNKCPEHSLEDEPSSSLCRKTPHGATSK